MHGEKEAANRVPPAQREAFEAIRASLQVLQQAVQIDASERILSERRARSINHTRGLVRS